MTDEGIVFAPVGRIDALTAESFGEELARGVRENAELLPYIDLSAVGYISSAGLRALLMAAKATELPIHVTGVSEELYDIFVMTGFTGVLVIEKAANANDMDILDIRTLDISGLEMISRDDLSCTYLVDAETIVKVYDRSVSLDHIRACKKKSEVSLRAGVPTCISYDVVDCGGCYGLLYERMFDAVPLAEVMKADREHMGSYASRIAGWIKTINAVDADNTIFPPVRRTLRHMLPRLEEAGILSRSDVDRLINVVVNVPNSSCYIHGNITPASVLVSKGGFIAADAISAGSGHPIFDLSSIAWYFKLLPQMGITSPAAPFTAKECEAFWDVFIEMYFGHAPASFTVKAEYQIMQFAAVRYLCAAVLAPELVQPGITNKVKRAALSMCDVVEPLVF